MYKRQEETYGKHLGMGKTPFYLTDGKDVAFALGGLNLRTRDYAKFGQLFLQGGEWEGKQLIPAEWVKASTVNLAPNTHPVRGSGYGYQWWVPMPQEGPSKGDYFGVGIYGQYVYVNPAMNMVIAKNAADREFTVEQSNGQDSMNMNIDIFRSLAEQFTKSRSNSLLLTRCEVESILGIQGSSLPSEQSLEGFATNAYEILTSGDEGAYENYRLYIRQTLDDPVKRFSKNELTAMNSQVNTCLTRG